MKVYVKVRYAKEITVKIIDEILRFLNLKANYDLVYIKGDGRNIIIETENKNIFVILSREKADARNAFLAQYIPTVLKQYISFGCEKEKEIYIYLLNTTDGAKSPYILDTYRAVKTLGIGILNETELRIVPILPYETFREWKNAKFDRQQYNLANQSSYAMEDENEYTVFGKLYGANGKDSTLIACLLAQIAKKENKKLNYVQIKEHGTESISKNDRILLENYGVSLNDGDIILKNRHLNDRSTCRKQDEFKFNLLEKYGSKRCYLCGCDIETNIIASHIHRITDIDHSDLSEKEKRRQAVDGDNGFWLCANHDKLFEFGVITFNKSGQLVISSNLKTNQIVFVKNITDSFKVEEKHLTQALIGYLAIHNKRVGLED